MSDQVLRRLDALETLLERLRKVDAGGVVVSYTPTYEGGTTPGATTYSVQVGAYIREGNKVTATGTLIWTAATGTGNARVSLPIAAVNTTDLDYSGGLDLVSVTFANSTPTLELIYNTAYFQMRSPATNAAGALVQMEAAGTIIFTVTYFAE
jgi:hypothetical protein